MIITSLLVENRNNAEWFGYSGSFPSVFPPFEFDLDHHIKHASFKMWQNVFQLFTFNRD